MESTGCDPETSLNPLPLSFFKIDLCEIVMDALFTFVLFARIMLDLSLTDK